MINKLIKMGKYNGQVIAKDIYFDIESYRQTKGIKAMLFHDDKGRIYKFIVLGRSNYAAHGEDIVASAVSILALNTIKVLEQRLGVEMNRQVKQWDDDPYVECRIQCYKNQKEEDQVTILLEALVLGLEAISEQYGKCYLEIFRF